MGKSFDFPFENNLSGETFALERREFRLCETEMALDRVRYALPLDKKRGEYICR